MPSKITTSERSAYVITGPTSGIGYRTALELAKHGTVVLVGRDPVKLAKVQRTIEQLGGRACRVNSRRFLTGNATRAFEGPGGAIPPSRFGAVGDLHAPHGETRDP